jgi:hypothetical protein
VEYTRRRAMENRKEKQMSNPVVHLEVGGRDDEVL